MNVFEQKFVGHEIDHIIPIQKGGTNITWKWASTMCLLSSS